MFQIYNENMELVPLPVDELGYGLRGLDLEISSTGQTVTEQSIPGWPGTIITGYQDSDRALSISVRLKAKDSIDYSVKKDEIFAFFKRLGTFYVARDYQNNKLMKVKVIESYSLSSPAG